MLLRIPDVLSPLQVADLLSQLEGAGWADGKATAGYQSAMAKDNDQLAETDPLALRLGEAVLQAMRASLLFQSAALPTAIAPPLISRYRQGQGFGVHVDNAIRHLAAPPWRIRTDLSVTLFLSAPESYDGGELVIEDVYGQHRVKGAAGEMVLYPSTSLHHVEIVTRGQRIAAVTWVQSLVQDEGYRSILFDMDLAIQRLRQDLGADDHPSLITLTGAYHNLLRRWAQV